MKDLTGHYEPNREGAPTLRDAQPLRVGQRRVTVTVEGRTAYLFVGGTFTAPIELPVSVNTPADVHRWARHMIADGYTGEVQNGITEGDVLYIGRKPHPRHIMAGTMGRHMLAYASRICHVATVRGVTATQVVEALHKAQRAAQRAAQ